MAEINIPVTLVTTKFDDYNNIESGHFSATLPPNRFPAPDARGILNEQVIPQLLKRPVGSVTLTNLARDARGYAFSIVPHSPETKAALANLTEGESIIIPIEVDTPDDFGG